VAVTCVVWSQTQSIWLYFAVLMVASIAGQGLNYIGNYSIISNWFTKSGDAILISHLSRLIMSL